VKLRTDRDGVDLIAEAQGADLIAIPVERLDPDFFQLRTGVAGQILQKFATYGRRVAIVGDISRQVEESRALHDFVAEANRAITSGSSRQSKILRAVWRSHSSHRPVTPDPSRR
jgi:hypothetical protein